VTLFDDMHEAGADPRDLSQSQLSEARKLLTSNLFLFAWEVFGYKDLIPELHGRIAHIIGQWGQPGYERLMVQIPREYFKTSLCTRANSLWQIVREPDLPVAIFNERLENTAKWIRAIKDVVQSSVVFHTVFKDLMPPGIAPGDNRTMPRWWKWSDTEINFERAATGIPEASITGLGIGAASAGGHWPKTIKDDLISEDAARSAAVMDHSKEWFDKSLYLERPALKGMDLINCTRWSYDDLYSYVAQKYQYKVYRRAAIEDGKSIFPQKLTLEELQQQQQRDPYGFSSQMMNRPMPGKEMNFNLEWLRWGRVEDDSFKITHESYLPEVGGEPVPRVVHLQSMNKAILLDPAPSEARDRNKERNARNGLVVVGKDFYNRRFVLDVWAERVDPLDVMHKLLDLAAKWGTYTIGIEEVNFSKVYRHWLTELARQRKVDVRFLRLNPKDFGRQDKDTRIAAKIPDFREGFYYLNQATTQPLVQEYVEFPYGATRDLMDALAYDVRVRKPASPEEMEAMIYSQPRGVWPSSTRDPVTGY
jgi:hypothetical protein